MEDKESVIIRSPYRKINEGLLSEYYSGKKTIAETFKYCVSLFKNRICYTFRRKVKEHVEKDMKNMKELLTIEYGPVEKITYEETLNLFQSMASGLLQFDEKLKKKGGKIGIYMETCKEWQVVNNAAQIKGVTVVTCYANLGMDALIFIINECELSCMVTKVSHLKKMEENGIYEKCPCLKKIITVGKDTYKAKKYETKNFYDVLIDGKNNPNPEMVKCEPNDLALVMYTSGTTGNPKGVMLSQGNIVADSACCRQALDITEDDVHIAYLPSAHAFEYVLHYAFLFAGCKVGFATPRTLMAKPGGAKYVGDLSIVKPTIICGVPRVWETIKKAVLSGVNAAGGLKKYLFMSVLEKKYYYLEKGQGVDVFLDNVVFKKPRQILGGKVRLIVSGGAPLSRECQMFFSAVLGPVGVIIQGYGLTETTAASTVQPTTYFSRCDSVGYPVSVNDVKLIDVPELKYLTSNDPPEGEVCMKGTNISQGYYNNPEKTKEVYDEDGWFHSGDIGRINKDGSLSIIDRKKNLVKLSGGEYVAIEQLEMIYATSSFFQPNGICVHVDSLQSNPVAVAVLDPIFCSRWAKENNVKGTIETFTTNKELKKAILQSLADIAKRYKKANFEYIKDITLYNDIWGPHNDLTTASMKLKRRTIYQKYDADIKAMYEGRSESKTETDQLLSEKNLDYPEFFKCLNPDF